MPADSPDILKLRLAAAEAHQAGHYQQALEIYNQILKIVPNADDVLTNVAEILLRSEQYNDAIALLDRAIGLNPTNAVAWHNLGYVYFVRNDLEMSEKCSLRAIALSPTFARAYFVLGNVYSKTGRYQESIENYKSSLRLNEADAEVWCNLGLAYSELEQHNNASVAYLESLKHDFNLAATHANLALLFLKIGQSRAAQESAERALSIDPNNAYSFNLLGSAFSRWGMHDEALAYFRRGIESDPNAWKIHSNLMFCALHQDGTTLSKVRAMHEEWYTRHGAKMARTNIQFNNTPDPHRRLRVGFVSGDFRSHPVGYFILGTLKRLIAENPFDIFFYANQFEEGDPLTTQFQAMAGSNWRPIWGVPHDKVLSMMSADGIDVLFDLTGHNNRHRMDVFCARAAPVQVTWAGYMATTGVPEMDWLLGDGVQTPLTDQPYYTEKLYNMPHSFIAYTPPIEAPPPSCLPYDTKGYLTFACFNKTDKITPRAIRLWAAALRQMPNSRLLLKFHGLDDTYLVQLLTEQFVKNGVDANRLTFETGSQRRELLERYNAVDMVLDPVPYTGSTSTLEAAWMSTPLITLTGDIFPARHASSYLQTIGVSELIAKTESEYVEKIVALAKDLPRLRHYKQTLRQQMQQSPMCDQNLFVPEFIKAICHFWREWCLRER